MSATRARPERERRLVSLSLAFYQALLLLYPARFRRAYGAQMAQVFRDSCRAAIAQGDVSAFAHVWLVTLGDLVVTALAERMEQDITMKRLALYRATGMVSLVGVGVWILGTAAMILGLTLAHMTAGPPLPVLMILPTAWMFFIIGCVGLYSWLAERRGALVWIPGIVAIAMLLAMMVSAMYWTYFSQIGAQQIGSAQVVNLAAASMVNEQLDSYAYAVTNLGYPALGLAFVVTSLLTWRIAALRAVTRMVLVMGAVGMLYYFFTDMGAPALLRDTGTPGILGMMAGSLAFYTVWLGGWVLLGRTLWKAGAIQALPVAARH